MARVSLQILIEGEHTPRQVEFLEDAPVHEVVHSLKPTEAEDYALFIPAEHSNSSEKSGTWILDGDQKIVDARLCADIHIQLRKRNWNFRIKLPDKSVRMLKLNITEPVEKLCEKIFTRTLMGSSPNHTPYFDSIRYSLCALRESTHAEDEHEEGSPHQHTRAHSRRKTAGSVAHENSPTSHITADHIRWLIWNEPLWKQDVKEGGLLIMRPFFYPYVDTGAELQRWAQMDSSKLLATYNECVEDIHMGWHPLSFETAVQFAVLQLAIEVGHNEADAKHVVKTRLSTLVPPVYAAGVSPSGPPSAGSTPSPPVAHPKALKGLANSILRQYRALRGKDDTVALRRQYVTIYAAMTTCGCTFFGHVVGFDVAMRTPEAPVRENAYRLGVSASNLLLVDTTSNAAGTVIERWPLSRVVGVDGRRSPPVLTLRFTENVVPSAVLASPSPNALVFRTDEAEAIAALARRYAALAAEGVFDVDDDDPRTAELPRVAFPPPLATPMGATALGKIRAPRPRPLSRAVGSIGSLTTLGKAVRNLSSYFHEVGDGDNEPAARARPRKPVRRKSVNRLSMPVDASEAEAMRKVATATGMAAEMRANAATDGNATVGIKLSELYASQALANERPRTQGAVTAAAEPAVTVSDAAGSNAALSTSPTAAQPALHDSPSAIVDAEPSLGDTAAAESAGDKRRKREPYELEPDEVTLGERLGAGGYGTVFRGQWRGIEVAVKQIKEDAGVSTEDFVKEIQIMSKLRHPNIVLFLGACFGEGLCAGSMFYITEFVAQGNLHDVLNRTYYPPLSWRRKLGLALGAARGLNYLHKNNPIVLHRDLKSLNILVDENWVVKVADFGLSKFSASNNPGGPMGTSLSGNTADVMSGKMGTLAWTAPEIIKGEAVYSKKSDVYSFGIVLWEILTGEFPWKGATVFEILHHTDVGDRPPIPANADSDYVALMKRCWHDDPNMRPDFDEILAELQKLFARAPRTSTAALVPSPPAPASPNAAGPSAVSTRSSRSVSAPHVLDMLTPEQQLLLGIAGADARGERVVPRLGGSRAARHPLVDPAKPAANDATKNTASENAVATTADETKHEQPLKQTDTESPNRQPAADVTAGPAEPATASSLPATPATASNAENAASPVSTSLVVSVAYRNKTHKFHMAPAMTFGQLLPTVMKRFRLTFEPLEDFLLQDMAGVDYPEDVAVASFVGAVAKGEALPQLRLVNLSEEEEEEEGVHALESD